MEGNMAVTKVKHSVYLAQPKRLKKQSAQQSTNPKNNDSSFNFPGRKVVQFPQAKGKLVKHIEFSSEPGHDGISIKFQDETGLHFAIETGFALRTDYSDWKNGEQRVLRRWRIVRRPK
jgi:hypothetical protein